MMEAALTIGSVGDIIAVCQVAIQLCHAIKSGSAKEYQALRQDLDAFTRILMLVIGTSEQRDNTPWLSGLAQSTKSAVDQCAVAIQDMLDHIQPRYSGLGAGASSQGKLKDTYRKIEWSMNERKRLHELQELLSTNIQRLSLLVQLTTQRSNYVDNKTIMDRIAMVDKCIRNAEARDGERLDQLRRHHDEQLQRINAKLEKQAETGSQAIETLKRTFTALLEVKDMIGQLTQAVVSLQVSASNQSDLRRLDPTKELPVILEDSLGRLIEIPACWIGRMQWRTMRCIIEDQFQGTKGAEMVQRSAYALEEGSTGQDLDDAIPLSQSLRRGMRLTMTMVFRSFSGDIVLSGSCPRCESVTGAPEGTTVECPKAGCGMFFRLQTQRFAPVLPDSPHNKDVPFDLSVLVNPAEFQRVRILHWPVGLSPEATDSSSWRDPIKVPTLQSQLDMDLTREEEETGWTTLVWNWYCSHCSAGPFDLYDTGCGSCGHNRCSACPMTQEEITMSRAESWLS